MAFRVIVLPFERRGFVDPFQVRVSFWGETFFFATSDAYDTATGYNSRNCRLRDVNKKGAYSRCLKTTPAEVGLTLVGWHNKQQLRRAGSLFIDA